MITAMPSLFFGTSSFPVKDGSLLHRPNAGNRVAAKYRSVKSTTDKQQSTAVKMRAYAPVSYTQLPLMNMGLKVPSSWSIFGSKIIRRWRPRSPKGDMKSACIPPPIPILLSYQKSRFSLNYRITMP